MNLSSQIVLNNVPEQFYRPRTAVERSEMTRCEKISTEIFSKAEEGVTLIADTIEAEMKRCKAEGRNCVLGLGTGQSLASVYAELVRRHEECGLSFANVTVFNAYEYFPLSPESTHSSLGQLRKYILDHVDIMPENIFSPDGTIAQDEVLHHCRQYEQLINSLFDIYLGKVPEKFTYKGKEYTPKSFAESLGICTDDYVMLTSFTHKPYYEPFEIEIPDNWEHDRMYNLPLDELIEATDHALTNGYTVCWDGDVSERGFSFSNGVAINPEVDDVDEYKDSDRARWGQMTKRDRLAEVFQFKHPYPEVNVTPEIRQQGYESFATTDDHLMHLTGIAKDQNGTKYYITKNSWAADSNKFGGYLNMSESYVRAKTIFVMMHKDSLPKELKNKLGIK